MPVLEPSIPCLPGLRVGDYVDMKTLTKVPTEAIIQEPIQFEVNEFTRRFSFIDCTKDIQEVLSLPPEYVLKVKTNVITDKVIEPAFQNLGKPRSFTLIFRATYVKQRQETIFDTESKLDTDTSRKGFEDHRNRQFQQQPTHFIKSMDLGQELVIILTVTDTIRRYTEVSNEVMECDAEDNSLTLRKKLEKYLNASEGDLTESIVTKIKAKASALDDFCKDKQLVVDIKYCSFVNMDNLTDKLSDLFRILENFSHQCSKDDVSLTDTFSEDPKFDCSMNCFSSDGKIHQETHEEKPIKGLLKKGKGSKPKVKTSQDELKETSCTNIVSVDKYSHSDTAGENFVRRESSQLNTLRFKLQPIVKVSIEWDEQRTHDELQHVATCEKMFNLHRYCEAAENRLKEFRTTCEQGIVPLAQVHKPKVEKLQTCISNVKQKTTELIGTLDFINPLSKESAAYACSENPLLQVNEFIKNVTTRLPPGGDIDLLLIGKTGQGKSSTGNSILLTEVFETSIDAVSMTAKCEIRRKEIDGRKIKVIDTPGISDTRLNRQAGRDSALSAFSKAVIGSSKGFNALLLVFRLPIKLTAEEHDCIELLKKVLGEKIFETNIICVFTFGDIYKNQMVKTDKGYIKFNEWCKNQKENTLHKLFKQCNYRCVLFNNITEDLTLKKQQLIRLVNLIDSEIGDTRYTNFLFQMANEQREMYMASSALQSEETFEEITLLMNTFNNLASNDISQDEKEKVLFSQIAKKKKLEEIATKAGNSKIGGFVMGLIKKFEEYNKVTEQFNSKLEESRKLFDQNKYMLQKKYELVNEVTNIIKYSRTEAPEIIPVLERRLKSLKEQAENMLDTSLILVIETAEESILNARKSFEEKETLRKQQEEDKKKKEEKKDLKKMQKFEKQQEEDENRKKKEEELKKKEILLKQQEENIKKEKQDDVQRKERLRKEQEEEKKRKEEREELEKIEKERKQQEEDKKKKEEQELRKREEELKKKQEEHKEIEKKEIERRKTISNISAEIEKINTLAKNATLENFEVLQKKLAKLRERAEQIGDPHLIQLTVNTGEALKTGLEKSKYNKQFQKIARRSSFYSNATDITNEESKYRENCEEKITEELKKNCFPASSKVTLSTGKSVTIENLQVGDKVLAVDKNNSFLFDTVYMFGHREPDVLVEFKVLSTASRRVLVSAEHYVYIFREGSETCVAAKHVNVGDCLLVETAEGLQPELVQTIRLEQESGLFAPFTQSGTIVVNGALMSCYVDVLPFKICHSLLWPLRQLYRLSPQALSYVNGSPSNHPIPLLARAFLKLINATQKILSFGGEKL